MEDTEDMEGRPRKLRRIRLSVDVGTGTNMAVLVDPSAKVAELRQLICDRLRKKQRTGSKMASACKRLAWRMDGRQSLN